MKTEIEIECANRKIHPITAEGLPDFSQTLAEVPSHYRNLTEADLDYPYNDSDLILYGAYIGAFYSLKALGRLYKLDPHSLQCFMEKLNHPEFGNLTLMSQAEYYAEEAYDKKAMEDMCAGDDGHFNRVVRTLVDSIDHQDAKKREVCFVLKKKKKINSF